jgi:hypothetical protein
VSWGFGWKPTSIHMLLNIRKINLKFCLKGKEFFGKLQALNICVRLPRWMCFRFGKNTGQRHPLRLRSVQLCFWKVCGLIGNLRHPYNYKLITQLRWRNFHLSTPWTHISHLLSCFERWKNYKGTRLLVWMVWKLSSFGCRRAITHATIDDV